MTGYGKSEMQDDEFILSMELRSINSRFLDFSSRLPKILLPFEDKAVKLIKKKLIRGRVTLTVKIDYISFNEKTIMLDHNKLDEYVTAIEEIKQKVNVNDMLSIGDVISLPDVFLNKDVQNDANLQNIFIKALNGAIIETERLRLEEGRNIQKDLSVRLNTIYELINNVEKLALDVQKDCFTKYKEKIEDIISNIDIEESRIYQEAAIIAEKKDITEEVIRLKSHMDLFKKYMNSDASEGKKLNFLLQEMGREINTIGSKTDFIELSHMVVELKNEIEKIREQVQNIV